MLCLYVTISNAEQVLVISLHQPQQADVPGPLETPVPAGAMQYRTHALLTQPELPLDCSLLHYSTLCGVAALLSADC
jgi:hypothetical protein